jgi:hypothetical protein
MSPSVRLLSIGLTACLASSALAEDFVFSTKSFINTIDRSGITTGQDVMACMVHAGTIGSENPGSSDKGSGGFRLFSSANYAATCDHGTVTVALKDKSIANGREFFIFATDGVWDPQPAANPSSGKSVTISYGMKGEPNALGNCFMNAAKSRQCTWIWHRVTATFSCSAGRPTVTTVLEGSDFPSHRLWVNGQCANELDQKAFDALWRCQGPSSDSSKVVGGGQGHACHK